MGVTKLFNFWQLRPQTSLYYGALRDVHAEGRAEDPASRGCSEGKAFSNPFTKNVQVQSLDVFLFRVSKTNHLRIRINKGIFRKLILKRLLLKMC